MQNIGAYGAEVKDVISEIEAVEISSGRVVKFKGSDCGYSYRQSAFKHEWKNQYLITYVTYQLSRTFKPQLDYGNIRSQLEQAVASLKHSLRLTNCAVSSLTSVRASCPILS